MRLLYILALVSYSSQKCLDRCNELVIKGDRSGNKTNRFRRVANPVTPDMKTSLGTGSSVMSTLADIPFKDAFSPKFFNIGTARLVTMLKGFSILGSIAALFLEDSGDLNTEKIIKKLDKGFDELGRKIDRQTIDLKLYINQKFFEQNVMTPVDTVVKMMNYYRNNSNARTRQNFLDEYANAKIKQVITTLLRQAPQLQEETTEFTEYDRNRFKDIASLTTRYFLQAYFIESFRAGVRFQNREYLQEMKQVEDKFKEDFQNLKASNNKNYDTFEKNYLNGSMPKIFQNAVNSGGDNCNVAQNILNDIHAKGHSNNYHVMVVSTSNPREYFRFGFIENSTFVQSYNEKTVVIAQPTTAFNNSKNYYFETKDFKAPLIDRLAGAPQFTVEVIRDFANRAKCQMVTFAPSQKACLKSDKKELTDNFIVRNERFSIEQTHNVFVLF